MLLTDPFVAATDINRCEPNNANETVKLHVCGWAQSRARSGLIHAIRIDGPPCFHMCIMNCSWASRTSYLSRPNRTFDGYELEQRYTGILPT